MAFATNLRAKLGPWTAKVQWLLWVLLLLSIPITSFPWLARYIGMATVSPLSGIFALLLCLLFLIPTMLRSGRISPIMLPLVAFILVALVACLQAPFLGIVPFKIYEPLGREVRAFITLAVGIVFYLLAAMYPQDEKSLARSLRWIHIGGLIMLIWSTVQILRLPYSYDPQPAVLNQFHRFFSIRDLFRTRITGFAYEPSWLADQLVILYLPLWLASVLRGYTMFPLRWRMFTLELVLLLWGTVVLFFSYSRIGWAAWAVVLLFLLAVAGWQLAGRLARRGKQDQAAPPKGLTLLLWFAALLVFIALVALVIWLAALTNERIRDIVSVDFLSLLGQTRFPVVYNIANHLEMAERLMYWISAFLVFSHYPLLGVGLGNVGFFFRSFAPAFSSHLPETIRLLSPSGSHIPNAKNLWLRLLAETGILGFLAFAIWLMLMAFVALRISREKNLTLAVIGLAAGMALIAQLLEGMSLDSFALPQLWIMLGLLTAAWSHARNANEGRL